MALTFTKSLSETTLLYSGVNNVVEFSSDSAGVPFKCTIALGGFSFEITPINGSFSFNFKTVFKRIVLDYFEDAQQVDLNPADDTTFVKDMSQVYRELPITYTVAFQGGSTDVLNQTVNLLQSVKNFQDERDSEIQTTSEFALLAKPVRGSNRLYRMCYWEGYPFDVQAYKRTAGNVKITNRTNLAEYTFNLPNKVNRIYFSDTDTTSTLENILPLVSGFNQLEFDTGDLTTILLEKKQNACGVYLKWKNHNGGWFYWLFDDNHNTVRESDDLGYISNDFQNIDNNNFTKNIGKESYDVVTMGAINVNPYYRDLLESLFDSPKVYMHTGDSYSKNEGVDWLSVKLNTNEFVISPYRDRPFDMKVEIELPKRNTLTL